MSLYKVHGKVRLTADRDPRACLRLDVNETDRVYGVYQPSNGVLWHRSIGISRVAEVAALRPDRAIIRFVSAVQGIMRVRDVRLIEKHKLLYMFQTFSGPWLVSVMDDEAVRRKWIEWTNELKLKDDA